MRTVSMTYYAALNLNRIMWNTYVSEIIDISKLPEFTSALQHALNQQNIILTIEQQLYLDCLLNPDFFQNNFADSMLYVYRLVSLLNPQKIVIPTLAQIGVIKYLFPFSDGTYAYVRVLSIPGDNVVDADITDLIIKAATDPNVPPEDQAFIQALLDIPS